MVFLCLLQQLPIGEAVLEQVVFVIRLAWL